MSKIILACSSLTDHVKEAQKRQHTDFEVKILDRAYHIEPDQMKAVVKKTIEALPADVDTVLVAMGFCGGVWDHVSFDRTVVIPRVDDCVSLLLHTDDDYHPNLKESGHLYLYENDPETFSALHLMRDGQETGEEYKGLDPDFLFHMWFDPYHNMDIIDTGLNDCYSEEYVEAAQKEADKIQASLGYAEGSIRLLEKLVSGQWDEQFVVAKPGHLIRHGDFF